MRQAPFLFSIIMPNRLENYSAQRKHSLIQTNLLGAAISPLVYVFILATGVTKGGEPMSQSAFMLWGLLFASVVQNAAMAFPLWRLGRRSLALAAPVWAAVAVGSYVAYQLL